MDNKTAKILAEATSEFYRENAASFSASREKAWSGWQRILDRCFVNDHPFKLLDVGCGNLRFERFLATELPEKTVAASSFYAVDNCTDLVLPDTNKTNLLGRFHNEFFQELDIVEALMDETLSQIIDTPPCDLSVALAIMHHIPKLEWRVQLVDALIDHTDPDEFLAVSFWKFLTSEKLSRKSDIATETACKKLNVRLEDPNDRFLGWQDNGNSFRYCHNFENDEIDAIIDSVCTRARVVERFSDDGGMNEYVILQTF